MKKEQGRLFVVGLNHTARAQRGEKNKQIKKKTKKQIKRQPQQSPYDKLLPTACNLISLFLIV
jgi:hypothetical protein